MLPQKTSQGEKIKKGFKHIFNLKSKKKSTFSNGAKYFLFEESSQNSKNELDNPFSRKAKTIFLIGSTGKGKSTLANTLVNEINEEGLFRNFREIFKESQSSVSGTREIQSKEFIGGGINYAIIDTVGLGDTKLKREEVLDKLAEAVYLAREGIAHIFFVIGVKFDEKEMANYNLLKSIIFDKDVVNYTTIIRTRFKYFEDGEKCKNDNDLMIKGGGELAKIVESCGERIIHVDNPSLNLVADDDEDEEEEIKRIEEEIENRKKIRISSRKKIIEHLLKVCQDSSYQPSKLKELGSEISDYMEEKFKKRAELIQKETEKIKETKEKEKVRLFNDLTELTKNNEVENSKQPMDNSNLEIKEFDQEVWEKEKKMFIKWKISSLKSEQKELEETKQLIEDIQKTEVFIRQVIFKHIFNNINDIIQINGSDNFLNNIVGDNDNFSKEKLNLTELQKQKKQLEIQLLVKGKDNRSLEQIGERIAESEEELLTLKKELLTIKEIFERWEKQGFILDQVQEWAEILGKSFQPEQDVGFCVWLRDDKLLTIEKARELDYSHNIEHLRKEYVDSLEKEDKNLVEFQFPLKEIPSGYWDKIEVGEDWDEEYVESTNTNGPDTNGNIWGGKKEVPMMISDYSSGSLWDRKFKNQQILNDFKKYVGDSDLNSRFYIYRGGAKAPSLAKVKVNEWFCIHKPHELTEMLKKSNKLFISEGYGKLISKGALEFLQSIIESQKIKVTLKLTHEELEKFKQENQQLWFQIEVFPK